MYSRSETLIYYVCCREIILFIESALLHQEQRIKSPANYFEQEKNPKSAVNNNTPCKAEKLFYHLNENTKHSQRLFLKKL